MQGQHWKQWPTPKEFPFTLDGQRCPSTWLTSMMEPAAKHWLDYCWVTVMSSVMEMKT